jgi:hypothetical protein
MTQHLEEVSKIGTFGVDAGKRGKGWVPARGRHPDEPAWKRLDQPLTAGFSVPRPGGPGLTVSG